MNRVVVGIATLGATMALAVAPTYAHDCFNPTKKPTAGVHYAITGFNEETEEPTLEQIGKGKGIGGFVAVPLPGGETAYVHSIGHSESHETVGGPGSMKEGHACNGKGIDYVDACGTGS